MRESHGHETDKIFEVLSIVQGLSAPRETDLSIKLPRAKIKLVLRQVAFRMIDLVGIGIPDRESLRALGYVTEFVNATRLCRTKTEPVRGWQKLPGMVNSDEGPRATQVSRQAELDIGFQVDLAVGRGLTAYCPISGQELVSNHGFLQHMHGMAFLLYYFSGVEPFYVMCGTATGSKICMYLPKSNTILLLQDPALRWYSNAEILYLFLGNLVVNAAEVVQYLASPTRPAAVYGNNNMGHFIWNDLAGLQTAHDRLALPHICETIELNRQFLPVHEIFPELSSVPSVYFDDESAAFQHCVRQHLLPIRFTDTNISISLSERIRFTAKRLSSLRGTPPLPTGKPLLWINLRSHSKVWVNQEFHYVKIINAIAEDYDGLSIFFDGFDDVRPVIEQIKPKLHASVTCHDGLGMSLLDSINWAFSVDAYVCPIGSGLVLVSWLANKPGVTHAEHAHMGQLEWWGTVRQFAIAPLAPALSQIRDIGGGLYCNYELDWTVVLSLLRQALNDAHFTTSERSFDMGHLDLQDSGGDAVRRKRISVQERLLRRLTTQPKR